MFHRFIRIKKIVRARQNIEFTSFPGKALVNESDFLKNQTLHLLMIKLNVIRGGDR